MSIFSETACRALSEYKGILRRHMPADERERRVERYGLKRRHLRHADDVALYRKVQTLLDELGEQVRNINSDPFWFSGLDEFYQHLRKTLSPYAINQDSVIHRPQFASRVWVNTIQLAATPAPLLTKQVSDKLARSLELIVAHGNAEIQKKCEALFKLHARRQKDFFLPLLGHYQALLAKRSAK